MYVKHCTMSVCLRVCGCCRGCSVDCSLPRFALLCSQVLTIMGMLPSPRDQIVAALLKHDNNLQNAINELLN